MKEENQNNSINDILKSISDIETLINKHSDTDKPYPDSEIKEILEGLREVRKSLSELEGKYLKLVEEHDKIEYRVKAVEDKLGNMNKHEELKHDREIKYMDYFVCSVIGSLVGFYISKLTGGN